VEAEGLTV
jgi:hypothetical protein